MNSPNVTRKILVADDSEVNRKLLRKMLCDEYDVLEAENGRAAYRILQSAGSSISAVLLDIVMPEMDGYELLELMHSDPALSAIPVIVVTANAQEDSEMRALTLGAIDYVVKPYNPRIIRRRLQNTIKLRETAAAVNALQFDELTGLYNRNTFFDLAARLISEKPDNYYIISSFNINNFKVINDQYGNAQGDRVLKMVAEVFSKNFAPLGGVCCRVMADHYAVIYPAELIYTERLAEIRRKASVLDGSIPPLHFSIGRCLVTDRTLSVAAMHDRATLAEESIRGRTDVETAMYNEDMRDKLLQEQKLVNEMAPALAGGEFEVWFQPQFNHSSGALIGAEALLRWRHPERGIIMPASFIPVFERNGFVYEVDKYVWESCCKLLRKWIDEGRRPLPVSVNVSRHDVFREDFLDVITGFTHKYAVPCELLRLEITESAFAESTEQIIRVVKQLIEFGFDIEIDDFGSGYSSLNTLKDVPAQILKLDMRFLEDSEFAPSESSSRGGNILESIVRMAKWLDMAVIAEGVETQQQADYLKSIGCSYVQGYLYSKPVPVSEYECIAAGIGKEEHLLKLETVQNLNNNSFWDPDSMDTLIFNSYVGGACIFEFSKGRIELLRASDKYAKVIGSAGMTVEDALKLEWSEHLDEQSLEAVSHAVEESVRTQDEITAEYVFRNLPGCPEETFLRSTLRVIASVGDRYLIYCTNENITAQREAEREKQTAQQKERRVSQQLQAVMDNINSGVSATIVRGSNIELLFANDRYYEIIGYTREQYEKEIANTFDVFHPSDKQELWEKIKRAAKTQQSTVMEFRAIRRDGQEIWLQYMLSFTHLEGVDELVLLGVFTDITERKLVDSKLNESDEKLRFLNDIAGDLLSHEDSEARINTVLHKVLSYFGATRTYIHEYDYDRRVCKKEFEIFAPGVKKPKNGNGVYTFEQAAQWLRVFEKSDFYSYNGASTSDCTPEALNEYAASGADSILAVALRSGGKVIGNMGVDNPTRHMEDYENLKALGDYMAVILTRRVLIARIQNDRETLEHMMNDIPGGFVRLRVKPDGGFATAYVNEPFCRLRGMTREQIMASDAESATGTIHPDDVKVVSDAIADMLATGQTCNMVYRLLRADNEYVPVSAFGRLSRSENGDMFINVYYADVSDDVKKEITLRETIPLVLRAIMSSSADLTFAKDKDLRYICCSAAFAAFAGQSDENGVVGKTDFELFVPDVAQQFRDDDLQVLESGESIVNKQEPIPSNDDVPHYSLTSKYVLRDATGAAVGLYGIGRDITEYRNSYEQLRMLSNNMPGGIATYSCSPDGIKLIYFNDGLSNMLGYRREEYEELARVNVMGRVLPDDTEIVRHTVERVVNGSDSGECFYRVRTKQGDIKWVRHKGVVHERVGNTAIINALMLDVTAEQHTAEELEKSREGMRLSNTLVDESVSSVYVCDAQTYELLYVNQTCARMCGKCVEDAKGLTCYKYLKNAEKPCEPCYMKACNDTAFTEKEYFSPASGKYYTTRGKFIDWDGRRALVEYLSDNTSSALLRQKLQENQRALQTATRNTGISFWQFDIGKKRLMWDAYKNTGSDRSTDVMENVPQSFIDGGLVHPDDVGEFLRMYNELFAGAESCECTVRMRGSQEEKYAWSRTIYTRINSPFYEGDQAIGFAVNVDLVQDLKIRYEREYQLRSELMSSSVIYYELNLTTGLVEAYNSVYDDVGDVHKGAELNDVLRTNTLRRAAPQDRERVRNTLFSKALIEAYERGETSAELTYRRRTVKNDYHYIKGTAVIMRRPTSDELIAFLYFRDVDDEVKKQLALQSVLGEEIEAVLLVNVERKTMRRFKTGSEHGEQEQTPVNYEEYQRTEIIGAVVPEDKKACENFFTLKKLERKLSKSPNASISYSVRSKDGATRLLRAKAFYLEETHSEIVISQRDVTLQYQAEERIETLRKSEQLLQLVVEHSGRVIYSYDLQTHRAVSIRPDASDALGLPNHIESLPDSLIDKGMVLAEDEEYLRKMVSYAADRKVQDTTRFRIKNSRNEVLWLDVKYTFVEEGGEAVSAVISCVDITEQHEKEVAFVRYRQAIDQSSADNVFFFEADITANLVERQGGSLMPKGIKSVNMSHTWLVETLVDRFIPVENRERVMQMASREHLLTVYADGQRELLQDWNVLASNGGDAWVRVEFQLVADPFTDHIKAFTLVSDITQEKRESIEMTRRAERDGMTGLFNKVTTQSRIEQRLAKADNVPCALVFADLDKLKSINDSYGHDMGDIAIQAFASVLRAQFRQSDIVGRIGGDEFVAFMTGVSEARIHDMIPSLIKKIAAAKPDSKNDIKLHSSIGIAFGFTGNTTYEKLFQQADTALYHVKRSGKDNYSVYTPDMEKTSFQFAQKADALSKQTDYFGEDFSYIARALSSVYRSVLSVNLTHGKYFVLQDSLNDFSYKHSGLYEALIKTVSKNLVPAERGSFCRDFSVRQLLEAYKAGEKSRNGSWKLQDGADGERMNLQLVFEQADNSDVLGIVLVKYD